MNNDNRPLLILDVDETLIYATKQELSHTCDFKVFDYYIYIRPFLEDFIYKVNSCYRLAIWSSAGDDYIDHVVKAIIPDDIDLLFTWTASKAVYRRNFQLDESRTYGSENHYHYVKPLKKVKAKFGIGFEQMLIVDDSPHKSRLNFGNAIYPIPFTGDLNDDELNLLSKYLESICECQNFRTLEKRNWRTEIN